VSGETPTRRRPAVSDKEKLQRREEIMTAAKKVFACNGFHATAIADVAKEANLPFDAVYHYFDSRDALFQR
jgi:AcrR family transcriptional regulator